MAEAQNNPEEINGPSKKMFGTGWRMVTILAIDEIDTAAKNKQDGLLKFTQNDILLRVNKMEVVQSMDKIASPSAIVTEFGWLKAFEIILPTERDEGMARNANPYYVNPESEVFPHFSALAKICLKLCFPKTQL